MTPSDTPTRELPPPRPGRSDAPLRNIYLSISYSRLDEVLARAARLPSLGSVNS